MSRGGLHILFRAQPDSPDLVFVEVEDQARRSVSAGEWWTRSDGYHVLSLYGDLPHESAVVDEVAREARVQETVRSVLEPLTRQASDANILYCDNVDSAVNLAVRDALWSVHSQLVPRVRDAIRQAAAPAQSSTMAPAEASTGAEDALRARVEQLEGSVRRLVALADDQLGTPCEQIRHEQELRSLRHEAELATEERDRLLAHVGSLRFALRGGTAVKDNSELMEWVADRLQCVYGEQSGTDYLLALRYRAGLIRGALRATAP